MSDLGMISEKGIADTAWCPMLWADAAGTNKRLKPDRNWDPMENIHQALTTGTQNKYVYLESSNLGRRALPYGDEFWLHVPTDSGKLLVTAKEVVWDPMFGPDESLVVRRKLRYDPRTEDHEAAEKNVQIFLLRHLYKHFPNLKLTVQTSFPNAPTMERDSISSVDLVESDDWAEEMFNMANGALALIPKIERCRRCWWKKCPSRDVTYHPVLKVKPGGPKTRSLD